jgi:hypothetical protein
LTDMALVERMRAVRLECESNGTRLTRHPSYWKIADAMRSGVVLESVGESPAERRCRDCDAKLLPTRKRGRQPVRCPSCRGE